MTDPMRIQRALARAGVASRRRAEELIAEGRVRINGEVARIGQSVDPTRDTITVDDAPVGAPVAAKWIVLHKPAGVMTTRHDPEGRRTVFDLVEDTPGLTYVGRLDFMTEGVLLLTTDGDGAHRLTHPSREVTRTYVITVRGREVGRAIAEARGGVELEDGLVVPLAIDAEPLGRGRWEITLTIAEGRTREVRRLCEALGLEVERLVRTSFGPVKLGTLPSGESRALTNKEAQVLGAIAGVKIAPPEPRLQRDRSAGSSARGNRPTKATRDAARGERAARGDRPSKSSRGEPRAESRGPRARGKGPRSPRRG